MKRLQFELSDTRVAELDTLAERTGLKTRVYLINAALTLFEWAVREREAGRIIASVDEKRDRYKEIEMPGFPSIAEEESTLEAILDQLELYLKTPEQEVRFTALIEVLSKDISAKNSKYEHPSGTERSPNARELRDEPVQKHPQGVEEERPRESGSVEGPVLVFDSPDPSDRG